MRKLFTENKRIKEALEKLSLRILNIAGYDIEYEYFFPESLVMPSFVCTDMEESIEENIEKNIEEKRKVNPIQEYINSIDNKLRAWIFLNWAYEEPKAEFFCPTCALLFDMTARKKGTYMTELGVPIHGNRHTMYYDHNGETRKCAGCGSELLTYNMEESFETLNQTAGMSECFDDETLQDMSESVTKMSRGFDLFPSEESPWLSRLKKIGRISDEQQE